MCLKKIISGGQTGADQGALDGAMACGFPHGGAVPAGRKTEDGPLPRHYKMEELESEHYTVRTEKNVADADATIIFSRGKLTGGSALTSRLADKLSKPCLHLNLNELSEKKALEKLSGWLTDRKISVLNVAGPRASSDPEIYDRTRRVISALLALQELRK